MRYEVIYKTSSLPSRLHLCSMCLYAEIPANSVNSYISLICLFSVAYMAQSKLFVRPCKLQFLLSLGGEWHLPITSLTQDHAQIIISITLLDFSNIVYQLLTCHLHDNRKALFTEYSTIFAVADEASHYTSSCTKPSDSSLHSPALIPPKAIHWP